MTSLNMLDHAWVNNASVYVYLHIKNIFGTSELTQRIHETTQVHHEVRNEIDFLYA